MSVLSAPVVIYDTGTMRVKEFKQRANTPQYQGRPDVVIFTVPADQIPLVVAGVPLKYWKVSGGQVVEMTAEEKAVIDAEIQTQIDQQEADKRDLDKQDKWLISLALVLLEEINTERQWIESFKSAVASATSLTDLKSRVAALSAMPDRTRPQLRTAIDNKYKTL